MAVSPAGVPDRATDFLGLKTGGTMLSDMRGPRRASTYRMGSRSGKGSGSGPAQFMKRGFRFSLFLALRKQLVELLFVGVVVEVFVEIGAGLHERNDALLRALGPDRLVDLERSGVHGAIRAATVENDVDAACGELVARPQRRLAELGN